MNRFNEKKLETAPDNPSMGDINDTTASNQEKNKEWYGTIPEILRNVPQKCRSGTSISFNSASLTYTLHSWLHKTLAQKIVVTMTAIRKYFL